MEKLLAILRDIDPDIDYENEKHLIDDGLLDSMQVLELVSTLEDEFDIEVTPTELVPANFNSADSMWKMIGRLQG
ncbi:MAG: acyl carrier protein [Lachnospiraceae bacterium]|jgi:D-alanine--poly(phosphoribitol) ligase subunit 2|uniref:Acyl carrier protein n=1 Tax=Porcincola intestinalis TaxID=2606632 RepID=A0A6L5X275_9FIRM|nr:acyl carrier protein [Porcincola intestinalis]MCI6698056.1 acyl carrier protein [Lachnospiraceae bacterium]MCI6767226.1 acyl carrier protein [Lachnospiraceae bacterium]MCI7093768.1 acyl carrier protein [Lachnospiraceae bacterium]MDY4204408.1 acyl carrier protein [Porcincola intestinalis]MDY5580040.1 acyl carrier protein [Porcincola intestinalis]